jgi:hypothetical protein
MNSPLTPALSPSEGERENRSQVLGDASNTKDFGKPRLLFPLPIRWGEGQGEGLFIQLR